MAPTLPNEVRRISRLRFDALAGYSRQPSAELFAAELEWYEHQTGSVLGVLILDRTDEDFGGIIVGRDEGKRFRCVDVVGFDDTPEAAEIRLVESLVQWARRAPEDFVQGGRQYPFVDIFAPIVPPARMSPVFAQLHNGEGFSPARGLIEAMMPYFEDVDGNFVEQFQSTAFDSRFWELYLFALLTEGGFVFDRQYQAPDFVCRGISQQIFVEAVTVNPSRQGSIITEPAIPTEKAEIIEYFKQYMPIKWGSALTSKLRKEYWNLPHVQGKPIILAIQDFHVPRAMTFTHSTLIQYLYGLDFYAYYDAEGVLQVKGKPVQEHVWGDKNIESGFFYLPNADMISAVIQNPTATISKFNRIGRVAGFGSTAVRMVKGGFAYSDPQAALPRRYVQDVDKDYTETWSEGVNVFHNPNARFALDKYFLPECMHHRLKGDRVMHTIPDFHPFTAETFILSPARMERRQKRLAGWVHPQY